MGDRTCSARGPTHTLTPTAPPSCLPGEAPHHSRSQGPGGAPGQGLLSLKVFLLRNGDPEDHRGRTRTRCNGPRGHLQSRQASHLLPQDDWAGGQVQPHCSPPRRSFPLCQGVWNAARLVSWATGSQQTCLEGPCHTAEGFATRLPAALRPRGSNKGQEHQVMSISQMRKMRLGKHSASWSRIPEKPPSLAERVVRPYPQSPAQGALALD